MRNLSPLQFYSLQFLYRLNNPSVFLRWYKLFLDYHCAMYAKKQNQQTLRRKKHRKICEYDTTANNTDDVMSRKEPILPPPFIGSPRYLHQHFLYAVAIAEEYNKPDLFITFTCNPQWPEITHSLCPNQQPHDRPDIMARVFNLKRKELMNDLINGNVIGRRVGNVDVIEFQKRELLYSDILFDLKEQDRLRTAQEDDQVIDSRLSPDQDTIPDGPQRE